MNNSLQYEKGVNPVIEKGKHSIAKKALVWGLGFAGVAGFMFHGNGAPSFGELAKLQLEPGTATAFPQKLSTASGIATDATKKDPGMEGIIQQFVTYELAAEDAQGSPVTPYELRQPDFFVKAAKDNQDVVVQPGQTVFVPVLSDSQGASKS